jgi:hypothetical protein
MHGVHGLRAVFFYLEDVKPFQMSIHSRSQTWGFLLPSSSRGNEIILPVYHNKFAVNKPALP